jgi:hypothetical protein
MSLLVEGIVYGLALLIWIFASPMIFGALAIGGSTGASGFVAALIPWAILVVLVGRIIYVFRSGGNLV